MQTMPIDPGTLATIASIIAAFGIAMLFFRIQRELSMSEKKERVWLPLADWLLVFATLISLLLVILPLLFEVRKEMPVAAAAAATILVAGYVPAILSHYRIVFGRHRQGQRDNPEPAEKVAVITFAVIAVLVFVVSILKKQLLS
jgi:uncharacterized membrane protein